MDVSGISEVDVIEADVSGVSEVDVSGVSKFSDLR